jgi:hypothetical protein
MSMRNGSNQAMATFCPAIAPRHVGLHPGFIDENKFRWSQLWLLLAPFGACLGNVLTRLLGGVEGLFLKLRSSVSDVLPPLGLSALQGGFSGAQFHGISSSMRF